MRILRSLLCLLTVFYTLAGCSQTGGVRPGAEPEMRTVASVGDKPLPIVSGEPGLSLRAETEETDLPPTSGSRISGRVFDDNGKPVPNARVRLAVSGAPGGKVVNDTTKRDGSFTLRGLRAGTSYAVIAESHGEEGMLTGRAQAKASQTDVRISLHPRDGGSSHASIRPARNRIEPISNIDPADDDESATDGHSVGKVNAEDIEPPPDEAASLAPRRAVRLSRASDDVTKSSSRGGWNARQPQSASGAGAAAAFPSSGDSGDEVVPESRSKVPHDSAPESDDDGPNPLPPALDTTATGAGRSTASGEDNPIKVARNTTAASGRSSRRRSSGAVARDTSPATGVVDSADEQEPRSMPEEILPGARATKRGSSRSPDESDTDVPAASAPINGAANTSVRPKWRDFTDNQAEVPLDESIRQAVHEEKPHESNVVTLTGAVTRAKPARPRLLGSSRPPIDDAVKQTVCRFDPSERRLVDFQLPGLDGKMVSLHDVDADVILLDFWGSWCSHCGTSTRHLGELQAKTGGKRFQVVGIACEKGSSLLDRRATAEKAMQTLGINYPVLISSKDGTCPVQQALQIQFYPTMVLLDRNGRVLAREEGATELTLTRMDRAIEAALKQ